MREHQWLDLPRCQAKAIEQVAIPVRPPRVSHVGRPPPFALAPARLR